MIRQIILELLSQPVEMLRVIMVLFSFFFFSLKLFFFPISPPGDDILTNEQCFHWKVANEISLGAF